MMKLTNKFIKKLLHIPGSTYISRKSFNINEGEFPNIHITWYPYFYFYLAWKYKFSNHRHYYLKRKWTHQLHHFCPKCKGTIVNKYRHLCPDCAEVEFTGLFNYIDDTIY